MMASLMLVVIGNPCMSIWGIHVHHEYRSSSHTSTIYKNNIVNLHCQRDEQSLYANAPPTPGIIP